MAPLPDQLFELVDKLSAARPFRHEPLGKLLGKTLEFDPAESHGYFTTYRARISDSSLVQSAEVRVPTVATTAPDGLLILEVKPLGIKQLTVVQRFGKNPELSVPTPRQPADSPLYLIYRLEWGQLKFGFSRGRDEQLVRIIWDATQPK